MIATPVKPAPIAALEEHNSIETSPAGFTSRKSEANSFWYMGFLMTVLADAEQTGGKFSLIEAIGAPGSEPPRHIHHREDETFYLLEGEATFFVGEEVFKATPGSVVFMPRGVPHHFRLETEQVKALVYISPSGFENWFREFSEEATTLTLPPPFRPTPEIIEKMMRASARYGVEFLPPAE